MTACLNLAAIKESKNFLLAPAHLVSANQFPAITLALAIRKDEVSIRNAWEVGPNDMDSVAILADDDPYIPSDVQDLPVRELLRLKEQRGKQKE